MTGLPLLESSATWRVDCLEARGTGHLHIVRKGRGPSGRLARRRRGMTITLADVEAARQTIAGRVVRTPMLAAPKLSALTGASVYVKYENLQVTNSFKERGAV